MAKVATIDENVTQKLTVKPHNINFVIVYKNNSCELRVRVILGASVRTLFLFHKIKTRLSTNTFAIPREQMAHIAAEIIRKRQLCGDENKVRIDTWLSDIPLMAEKDQAHYGYLNQ